MWRPRTRLGLFATAVTISGLVLSTPAIAQDSSDLTPDEVMTDLAMQGFFGVSVVDPDLKADLVDPSAAELFVVTEVNPLLRTSFYAETLDELGMVSDLPPVPRLSGVGVAWLTFNAPDGGRPTTIFDQYEPSADFVFPPGSGSNASAENMLAVGVQIDADLTDPAVCGGMQLDLVLVINNPEWGDAYVASPSFPGEYYQGGNFFPIFSQLDCEQQTSADTYLDHEVLFGLGNPGTALFTVDDGVTNGVILLSGETVNPDGSVRVVLFEHPAGESFTPDNTRYQSWPDVFDPPLSINESINTAGVDFGLVPAGPGPPLDGNLSIIEVPTANGTIIYTGPTGVPAGSPLEAQICVVDLSSEPVTGADWFATVGEPPSSADATHAEGVLDGAGCVDYAMDIVVGEGQTSFYTSDGTTVWLVTPITIETTATETTQPAIAPATQPAAAPTTEVAATPSTEPAVAPSAEGVAIGDSDFPFVPLAVTAVGIAIIGAGAWLVFGEPKVTTQPLRGPVVSGGTDTEPPSIAIADRPGKGGNAGAKPPPRIGLGTRLGQTMWLP